MPADGSTHTTLAKAITPTAQPETPAFAVHTFAYLNGSFSDPMTQVFADPEKRTWLFNMDGHQDGSVVIEVPVRRYQLTVIERRA